MYANVCKFMLVSYVSNVYMYDVYIYTHICVHNLAIALIIATTIRSTLIIIITNITCCSCVVPTISWLSGLANSKFRGKLQGVVSITSALLLGHLSVDFTGKNIPETSEIFLHMAVQD